LKTIASLFREYKPGIFFGILGAVMEILALAFFIPVLGEYFATGQVLRFPTVFVCGTVAIFGMLLWVSGIILSVVIKKHRQNYELMLNQFVDMEESEK
ncbi:MAG: glycosyl transferase, partial [Eubacteriales bacterium]|nr:glycosyl transferase [Eubacteriales bacterium]